MSLGGLGRGEGHSCTCTPLCCTPGVLPPIHAHGRKKVCSSVTCSSVAETARYTYTTIYLGFLEIRLLCVFIIHEGLQQNIKIAAAIIDNTIGVHLPTDKCLLINDIFQHLEHLYVLVSDSARATREHGLLVLLFLCEFVTVHHCFL